MVLPVGMYVTSCSEQWGDCDSVVLPSEAAFSNLKLCCPGAKWFVFQKSRQRERQTDRQRRGVRRGDGLMTETDSERGREGERSVS